MGRVLVFLTSLVSLTLGVDNVFFLPSGMPYVVSRENFIPYSAPIQVQLTPQTVPLPVHVRIGVPGLTKIGSTNSEELAKNAYSFFYQNGRAQAVENKKKHHVASNKLKILTPAGTILSHDVGRGTWIQRNSRQEPIAPLNPNVPTFIQQNCSPLGVLGGTVAGASGGPIGILLGAIGGLIGSCVISQG